MIALETFEQYLCLQWLVAVCQGKGMHAETKCGHKDCEGQKQCLCMGVFVCVCVCVCV